MSNYRRLISYIYAYEGGIKGKNVGFAKLEVRNGQCKIQVNVRNIYIGSQDTGVYLLSEKEEILVGKIFIRNGAGEFRTMVSVGNVAGSGQNMDQCYGLTVHNLSDSWQCYTTIWEDAVAHAAEVALGEATSEQVGKKEKEEYKSSIAVAVEAEIEEQSRQEEERRRQRESQRTESRREEPEQDSRGTESRQEGANPENQRTERPQERETRQGNQGNESPQLSYTVPPLEPSAEEILRPVEMGAMEIRPMEVTPIGGGLEGQEKSPEKWTTNRPQKGTAGTENGAAAQQERTKTPENASTQDLKPEAEESSGETPSAQTENTAVSEQPEETASKDSNIQSLDYNGMSGDENKIPVRQNPREQAGQGRQGMWRQQPHPFRQNQQGWWGQPGMLFPNNRFARPNRQNTAVQMPGQNQPGRADNGTEASQPQQPQPQQPRAVAEPGTQQNNQETEENKTRQETPGTAEKVFQGNLEQQDSQLKRLERDASEDEPRMDSIWQHFYNSYPKIQAFDYNGGCEILTIKPQDIGLLPREVWAYGNNSFLLHGYYNHRYLILARLNNAKGKPRFLLGVPGHYYSNEKYMAAMFGFPNFVLSKTQPAGDGRFGYWYTDVRLGS